VYLCWKQNSSGAPASCRQQRAESRYKAVDSGRETSSGRRRPTEQQTADRRQGIADNRHQAADSRHQTADSQADSRQQATEIKLHIADGKQQPADSRQQAAGSRPQVGRRRSRPELSRQSKATSSIKKALLQRREGCMLLISNPPLPSPPHFQIRADRVQLSSQFNENGHIKRQNRHVKTC
jgi:hypothetical protein